MDTLRFIVLNILGRLMIVSRDGRILPLVAGAAEGTDENLVPESLDEMDEDAARELAATLKTKYDEARAEAKTPQDVENLKRIGDAYSQVANRVTAIVAERDAVAQSLTDLDAQIIDLPASTTQTPETPAAEGEATPATNDDAAPAAQAASATPAPAATAGLTPAAVTAARGGQAAAAQRPSTTPARPRVGYVAAAGQREVQAGQAVDYDQIGRMVDSVKSIDGTREDVRAYVASLPAFEEMADLSVPPLTRSQSVETTDRMIREAVDDWKVRTGRTAALPAGRTAAICDPLDIIRDIPDCSTDADPFGDSLPQRPAGRLGFQYTAAISLSAVSAGVTTKWDDTAQAAVDPANSATWKPCVDIECPSPQSVRAEAVTACVRFDVTTELSNPERVQDILSKLAALRVRRRTQRLLTIADSLSSLYTFTSAFSYGAFPALIEAAMSVMARGTYDERINEGDYNIYLPPGLAETLVTDRAGRAYDSDDPSEENEAVADVIREVQNATGLRVVRLLDVKSTTSPFAALNAPGNAAAALPSLGGSAQVFNVRFIAPEAALYFSTGEEKTGIESSPELMRQNKRQWFSEEFVGLAKHGCHPWFNVAMTLCPNGARTGFNAPVACS